MAADLLDTIKQFEELLDEMRTATRDAHSVLKDLKYERREIDKLFTTDVKVLVNDQVELVVKTELDRIGPEIREHTNFIFEKVGIQIDKLITLTLGSEFALKKGREDLRPVLALKLREWIQEIFDSEKISTEG